MLLDIRTDQVVIAGNSAALTLVSLLALTLVSLLVLTLVTMLALTLVTMLALTLAGTHAVPPLERAFLWSGFSLAAMA